MPQTTKIEKFSARELLNLRNELLQSGIDSWQAAEVLSGFLTGRGYGVSAPAARNAIIPPGRDGLQSRLHAGRAGKSGLRDVARAAPGLTPGASLIASTAHQPADQFLTLHSHYSSGIKPT